MSDKCELCGSPMEVEVYAGFVAGHREGGLDCVRTQLAQSRAEVKNAREAGYVEGLTAYAWWKDGVQYVGTCGQTLEAAIALGAARKAGT